MKPIGVIRTPFTSSENTPIQSSKSNAKGHVEVSLEYLNALKSLDGFSHIILVYWFHKAKSPKLKVQPYLDQTEHGLFATRAPSRPNPIGISVVKLIRIKGDKIVFKGADMLDGTPLLDIKPYVPQFDEKEKVKIGWLQNKIHNIDDLFIG